MWERIKIPEPATRRTMSASALSPTRKSASCSLGPASPPMHDLMMIAALTGARLEAIVDLRAREL